METLSRKIVPFPYSSTFATCLETVITMYLLAERIKLEFPYLSKNNDIVHNFENIIIGFYQTFVS